MLRKCNLADITRVYFIINEAARAYDGVIPADCYHQPYIPMGELEREIKRMSFYGWTENGELVGVIGIESVKDVTLIRHAYVLPQWQKMGIGSGLLEHLMKLSGSWSAPGRLIQVPFVFTNGMVLSYSRIKMNCFKLTGILPPGKLRPP
jgi:GNAT superfamily N-acetyltransferase